MQGIPSIRVIRDGQLADQMEGPQGEAVLKEFIDRLTMSSGDLVRVELSRFVAEKNWEGALAVLQQAINEEPNNPAFKIEWADVLVQQGDAEGARTVLATIPEGTEGLERPATRLELLEEAAGFGGVAEVEAAVAADEDSLEARYQAAVVLAVDGQFEAALDHAMAILMRDREFREDAGRTTMVRILSLTERARTWRSAIAAKCSTSCIEIAMECVDNRLQYAMRSNGNIVARRADRGCGNLSHRSVEC